MFPFTLPDIPNDTFAGLSQFIAPKLQALGLSNLFSGGVQPMKLPEFDGWSLPNGTVKGILNPLPSYGGSSPSQESLGYSKPLPDYVKPGFNVPKEYLPHIQEASKLYNMPEDLIKAIIKQESDFNPNLVSRAGAVGLMQLMPATAADAGITNAQRYEPRQNILAATRYIRHIYDKYHNWPLTLAAYNAGPNRKDIRRGYIPNIPETRNYVRRVLAYWGVTDW